MRNAAKVCTRGRLLADAEQAGASDWCRPRRCLLRFPRRASDPRYGVRGRHSYVLESICIELQAAAHTDDVTHGKAGIRVRYQLEQPGILQLDRNQSFGRARPSNDQL